MQKIFHTVLLWTLTLCACSTSVSSPPAIHPSPTEAPFAFPTTAVPDPRPILTVGTPHIDLPPDGEITNVPANPQDCAFQWAYKDLPELSGSFQQSIQGLQPGAQANAFAFGEDCVRADGSAASFSVMETDFDVTLQVTDLANESDLGEWIVKVMQVIGNIPQEQIVGPRPGRVNIILQSGSDQKVVNFYIDQYQALPSGLSNSEIFRALQIPQ